MKKNIVFPKGFEWGTATASYQIEGGWKEDGKGESIWDRFTHEPGHIHDGTNGDVACDFYHRYKEDIEIARRMGIQVYRLSIAWARIYPEGTGKVNEKGIAFYKDVLLYLKKCGIKAAVTLYHWDLPQKLQDKGGWVNRDSVEWFRDYADTVFERYGDLVDYWITLNEPYCATFLGYYEGEHAPGYHSYSMAMAAVHHLLMAHGSAVRLYREKGLKGEIGVTLNMNLYYPGDENNAEDVKAAYRCVLQQNCLFGDPIMKGTYPNEFLEYLKEQNVVLPQIEQNDLELISEPIDFLGINSYFTEKIIENSKKWPLHTEKIYSGRIQTDADWDVDPDGIYKLLKWINDRYAPEKIVITENGAAFNDWVNINGEIQDYNRIEYLKVYLEKIHQAIEEGVPVQGYYVWCFCDNFEWAWGLQRRFGLIYVDYPSQKRIPKKSAQWYSQVIDKNGYEM